MKYSEEILKEKMDNRINSSNIKSIAKKSLVCITLLGLIIYGIYYSKKAQYNENLIKNQNFKTFSDMITYVEHTENYLLKALSAGTPQMLSNMLDGVTVCSHEAQSCLSALPIEQNRTKMISQYLVQLGDIAASWSHRAQNTSPNAVISTDAQVQDQAQLTAGKLTKVEYNTLLELTGFIQDLSGTLNTLKIDLEKNSYDWDNLSQKTIERLEKPFTDYSPLSYNGKYSIPSNSVTAFDNQKNYATQEECQAKAISYLSEILNCDEKEIKLANISENSKNGIHNFCFLFKGPNDETIDIDITKKEQKVYSMIINRATKEENLSAEQGIEAGISFLKSIGLNNMKNTEYQYYGDSITATYVYEQDNILCYPDMVKVKIALDNGVPLAFEGHKYIESHLDTRNIEKAKITMEDAKKSLSHHFEFEASREVIALSEYNSQYHAYEFSGRVSGRPVLIYVDANTGAERDIILITETETGISRS